MSELVEQVAQAEHLERRSSGVRVLGPAVERDDQILTPPALDFLAGLHRRFDARRRALLARRVLHREEAVRRGTLSLRPDTAEVRRSDWRIAPAPADLRDRRVEIVAPTEHRAAIAALNSGARVWIADLEDTNTPRWEHVIGGQTVLGDAVRRTIAYTAADGRVHTLRVDVDPPAILLRPRGLHLSEPHLTVDGEPIAGAFVDFGLYLFHNAAELRARGSGPYFSLPKLAGGSEARLFNDVFLHAQRELGLPVGTIRATVLIETVSAAFEMDEILYELRDHVCGLAEDRWDYLFSLVKTFRDAGPEFVLPDRDSVSMSAPLLRAYTDRLVNTCHRRGAHAIGGLVTLFAGQPGSRPATASSSMSEGATREAAYGLDGVLVDLPELVEPCLAVLDGALGKEPNQLDRITERVAGADPRALLDVGSTGGSVTEAGLRAAVDVGIRYLIGWLDGHGSVSVHHQLEDTATAEILRAQLWQWVHNGVQLETGATIDIDLVLQIVRETQNSLREQLPAEQATRLAEAVELFEEVALSERFVDFLTVPALHWLP